MKTEPSLSVNKLGEYLVASPYRQRKILEGLKYPKDDGGNWGWVHGEARNSIKDFFNGDLDEKYLLDCIKLLENRARTVEEKNPDKSSILLLKSVLNEDKLQFAFFVPFIKSIFKLMSIYQKIDTQID